MLPGAKAGERGLTAKRQLETFWGDGNIFYLDCGAWIHDCMSLPEFIALYTLKDGFYFLCFMFKKLNI